MTAKDFNFQQHLPPDFNENSKVWVYQSSRMFFISEALELEDMLKEFVKNWKSHGATVKGYANLFFGRFIIFMADESGTGVSGCSTDSSVRLIKEIEKMFKVEMFDRQSLAFIVKDKIELIPFAQFNYAVENNFINEETLYFNNTVVSKKDLEANWIIPLKQSWLNKQLGINNSIKS